MRSDVLWVTLKAAIGDISGSLADLCDRVRRRRIESVDQLVLINFQCAPCIQISLTVKDLIKCWIQKRFWGPQKMIFMNLQSLVLGPGNNSRDAKIDFWSQRNDFRGPTYSVTENREQMI